MDRLCIIIYFLVFSFGLCAQTDSLVVVPEKRLDSLESVEKTDSLQVVSQRKKGFFKKDYPNPNKALILALALPGSGQIYNKKYWKTPIFYGGMTALAIVEADRVQYYRLLKRNYAASVDMDENTVVDPIFERVNSDQLKRARDQTQVEVEYLAIGIGLLYLISVADAYVDAHLASFDVSDDLSLRFQPSLQGNAVGVGLAFRF